MAATRLNRLNRERLCHEHGALDELVTTLYRVLAERHETPQRVSHLLSDLTERVAAHFKDEEEAGLFEDLTNHLPHHAEEIAKLEAEHKTLMDEFLALNALATADGEFSAEGWKELEDRFRALTTLMCHHESRENDLLVTAYDDDIGNKD
ncbi:MAG: hemerythrin domain-containing protein [Planctomycetales bacterium]|nr:hemerythrin domain-containing protein [Planctomycetales bacterium]MCA9170461.1 hemerythrin domain-containing protein [Planctomycetales bacterium]